MTNLEKAMMIIKATNQGTDLEKHHKHIVESALQGELGQGTRLIFEDLWGKYSGGENASAQNDA